MSGDYDVLLADAYFCDLVFTGLTDLPQLGAEIFGTGFDIVPGAGFTTALALHRLGLATGWSCDFGDDFASQSVLDTARREGLDGSMFRLHTFPVRRITVSMSFPHDRAFVSFVDECDEVSPIPLIYRHRPRCVVLGHLQFGEDLLAIARATHAHGGVVYMDCQHKPWTLETPGVADALRAVDIFAPNADEALHLTGARTVESALSILSGLAPLVIIKLGANGAVARIASGVVRAPALPVDVFDTTGAGDCFNAGFLYGYLRGYSLEMCLRCGNICGGLSTTARGGLAAPSAAQVEEWLQREPTTGRS